MQRASLAALALWWGSLTTLGFLVVPLLFVHLPTPALAGGMAAKLFSAQAWVSVVCGWFVIVSQRNDGIAPVNKGFPAIIFIVGGVLLALLVEFAVAPKIVSRENLKLWHAVGSGMYLAQWLCAGWAFYLFLPSQSEADKTKA